jgi:hypothetical protein
MVSRIERIFEHCNCWLASISSQMSAKFGLVLVAATADLTMDTQTFNMNRSQMPTDSRPFDGGKGAYGAEVLINARVVSCSNCHKIINNIRRLRRKFNGRHGLFGTPPNTCKDFNTEFKMTFFCRIFLCVSCFYFYLMSLFWQSWTMFS